MKYFFRRFLVYFLNHAHLKLFNQPISAKTKTFIQNLGWVGMGSLFSVALIFIVNITAGRLLGPIEYGKYSLIISLGQIFIIPMLIGLNITNIKYISSTNTTKIKILYANNTFFISLICICLSILIFLIINKFCTQYLNINHETFNWLIFYSTILAFKNIVEGTIKGFHNFKLLSFLEILNSFTVFASFFIFLLFSKNYTYISYLTPVILGLLLYSSIYILKNLRFLINFQPNLKIISKLLNYSKFVLLGNIAGIALVNMDKFVINKYLSLKEVGLYSIYFSSSSFLSSYILLIFIQVFFPTVSGMKNIKTITNKIYKLMFITAIPIVVANILSTSLILYLVGNQYQKSLIYIILFSFLGMITTFSNILWWLITSQGKNGIKFTSIIGLILGFFNILIMIVFINYFKLYGIIISLIITNILMISSSLIKLNQKI